MTTIIIFLTIIVVKMKKICYNISCQELNKKPKEAIMFVRNRLKELRARNNLNQTELAKKAGISRQTVSLIERGEYLPSILIALKIARIFGEPVDNVFSIEEETEYNEQ